MRRKTSNNIYLSEEIPSRRGFEKLNDTLEHLHKVRKYC